MSTTTRASPRWARTRARPTAAPPYYDALVENTPQTLAANLTLPYHYSVRVPASQAPGTYTGTATVRSGAGDVVVNVAVTVYGVTIPPPTGPPSR
ncbi:hypothetical protein [Nonomuraea dietziae]|uniref:hypothetical protein n=1 Tax=Nonomuraea dietziae TaxID=65515 RepID=UPI0031DA0F38